LRAVTQAVSAIPARAIARQFGTDIPREATDAIPRRSFDVQEDCPMTDKTSSETQKKPGEKPPGKFHYNPGNMSGKTVRVGEGDGQPENDDKNVDKTGDKHDGGRRDGDRERADRRNS
jgi:hypothetical protein